MSRVTSSSHNVDESDAAMGFAGEEAEVASAASSSESSVVDDLMRDDDDDDDRAPEARMGGEELMVTEADADEVSMPLPPHRTLRTDSSGFARPPPPPPPLKAATSVRSLSTAGRAAAAVPVYPPSPSGPPSSSPRRSGARPHPNRGASGSSAAAAAASGGGSSGAGRTSSRRERAGQMFAAGGAEFERERANIEGRRGGGSRMPGDGQEGQEGRSSEELALAKLVDKDYAGKREPLSRLTPCPRSRPPELISGCRDFALFSRSQC